MHSFRLFLGVLVLAVFIRPCGAQEPIRMARTPDVSPDGKLIAFSYLGDIWVVDSTGGTARAITSHPAHEMAPVFSPDGRWIAFSSNRHGSYNVFVVSVRGGRPRRVTFDSENDFVNCWSSDGKRILFTSTRSVAFPPSAELYTVPVEGGMVHRVSAAGGKDGVYSPDGAHIAYVRGSGAWYRKGYRGSANDDIWICDADGSHNGQLTNFVGQDGSPMWSADGKTLYYVSELYGTPANIVCTNAVCPADLALSLLVGKAGGAIIDLGSTGRTGTAASPGPRQLTFHKNDAVRRARISANGAWIVYECGADLWMVSTKEGSTPRKLAINVYADDKVNPERSETFTSHATEFAVAPDEKHAVFAVHGKLFLTPMSGTAKAVQLTEGQWMDHGAAWAPDGNRLLFISDRSGHDNLYALEANDPDHRKLVQAHKFKVVRLTDAPEAEFGVGFAPDGKHVSFLRGGKLWTMNPDGSGAKAIIDQPQVFDYDWSPDSKWIVYAHRDGSWASELYIVPSGGPTPANPARNVTRYATYNGDVSWSLDGKKIAFLGDRRGKSNLLVLNLQKPLAPGVKPPAMPSTPTVDIDWGDVHLRTTTVTTLPIDETAISPDGSKVAFRGNGDLWAATTNGGQMTRLTTGNQVPRMIQWSHRKTPSGGFADVIYYLDGQGTLRAVRSTTAGKTPAESASAQVAFKVKLTVRADEEFAEMFDQTWRYLAENFYDPKFHGHDWNAVRAKYRPLVKYVAMKEDLYYLLYLMMGELNASHLGVGGYGVVPEEQTADLGLVWDEAYRGKGLKVLDVLKRGPADKRGLNLKAGDYVLAIDRVEITEATDLSKLLNGKIGEPVELQVAAEANAAPKARRRLSIQAASRNKRLRDGAVVEGVRELMYDRWVDNNARKVSELSNGKVGYIHIPSMDDTGLERFLRSLYSDNFDKDAIVLDVRYNGGGRTHDQVLNYLTGHGHTLFRERDGREGPVLEAQDRKWNKPLVLLINNRSYSDAEVFPSAFRTLGLGKLVGQPTGGCVIGTGEVRLIDGSRLRIPRIGVYTPAGVDMDKQGVQPDVLVETDPDQLAKGEDAQVAKAVRVLQADVAEWKKKNNPPAVAIQANLVKPIPRRGPPLGPAPTPPLFMPLAK